MADRNSSGFALVSVVFMIAIFFVLAMALMVQSEQQRLVATNEHDHLKALGFAEAGLDWATRRIRDSGTFSGLLQGPNKSITGDDSLVGLRSLSLTSAAQFTTGNETTASAIVSRDFGDGTQTWELFRVFDDTMTRANVYVRMDDNYDDDPDDPSNNDPLTDNDQTLFLTVVAEYPVSVDVTGAEQPDPEGRGRARRMLRTTLAGGGAKLGALIVQGDLDISSSLDVCGACANIHSNRDFSRSSGGMVCGDATSSGSLTGSCSAVSGACGGSYPTIAVPAINPYDDLFVPTLDTFDTSGDTTLPAGLRCPKATAADPGANKYFALVADAGQGRVFKAYWDFVMSRWRWRLIDNLASGNVILDDCGRVPGDPNYALGAADAIDDEASDEFYGWLGDSLTLANCASCLSPAGDNSFCQLDKNDFTFGGFIPYPFGLADPSFVLPGSSVTDTAFDVDPTKRPDGPDWLYADDAIWSPLYGSVLWVFGNTTISGNPGESTSVDFRCSATAGCSSGTLPKGLWQVSVISVGDIRLDGQTNIGPANPDADFAFQLITGRDLMIDGTPQEDTAACGGSCATTGFSDIKHLGGIYAAHEQISIGSAANIFGFLLGENALDCSPTVDAASRGLSTVSAGANIYYDCQHPPNPWAAVSGFKIRSWQEIE